MRISIPQRTLALGVGLIAAAAAAVPAHAASTLRNTSTCPTGKVAVGGGSQVVGEGSADFRTQLQETGPGTINGGAQSLWLTSLRNNDTRAHTIGLFAVCAQGPPRRQGGPQDGARPGR